MEWNISQDKTKLGQVTNIHGIDSLSLTVKAC